MNHCHRNLYIIKWWALQHLKYWMSNTINISGVSYTNCYFTNSSYSFKSEWIFILLQGKSGISNISMNRKIGMREKNVFFFLVFGLHAIQDKYSQFIYCIDICFNIDHFHNVNTKNKIKWWIISFINRLIHNFRSTSYYQALS